MVAVVGKKDWCLLAVCGTAAMSKVVAYKGATDAVGACESNGSWGRKWQSEYNGGRQCPR